ACCSIDPFYIDILFGGYILEIYEKFLCCATHFPCKRHLHIPAEIRTVTQGECLRIIIYHISFFHRFRYVKRRIPLAACGRQLCVNPQYKTLLHLPFLACEEVGHPLGIEGRV